MTHVPGIPLTRHQVIEMYFLEHRAKVLDIAAFLDRLDRAAPGAPGAADDFRIAALRRALAIVADGHPERARRILETWSDATDEPIPSAAGMKGAYGACPT
jgi:hypothetical protein